MNEEHRYQSERQRLAVEALLAAEAATPLREPAVPDPLLAPPRQEYGGVPDTGRKGWWLGGLSVVLLMALFGSCLGGNSTKYTEEECAAMSLSIVSGDDSMIGEYGNHC